MSTFEMIFAVSYVSFAIIWSTYLIAGIISDITKNGELKWELIVSVVIIINLALFILAKFC